MSKKPINNNIKLLDLIKIDNTKPLIQSGSIFTKIDYIKELINNINNSTINSDKFNEFRYEYLNILNNNMMNPSQPIMREINCNEDISKLKVIYDFEHSRLNIEALNDSIEQLYYLFGMIYDVNLLKNIFESDHDQLNNIILTKGRNKSIREITHQNRHQFNQNFNIDSNGNCFNKNNILIINSEDLLKFTASIIDFNFLLLNYIYNLELNKIIKNSNQLVSDSLILRLEYLTQSIINLNIRVENIESKIKLN